MATLGVCRRAAEAAPDGRRFREAMRGGVMCTGALELPDANHLRVKDIDSSCAIGDVSQLNSAEPTADKRLSILDFGSGTCAISMKHEESSLSWFPRWMMQL